MMLGRAFGRRGHSGRRRFNLGPSGYQIVLARALRNPIPAYAPLSPLSSQPEPCERAISGAGMIDRADEAAATRQGQRGDEQQGPASDHRTLAPSGSATVP